jgi:DNA-binding NarL/FixJ family response regulator
MHPSSASISVLVVGEDPELCDGLRLRLQAEGFALAGPAELADVVVLDIALPGVEGNGVAERTVAYRPEQAILLYTACEDPVVLRRALDSAASGIASKARDFGELLTAIRAVAAGQPYLDSRLMQVMAARTPSLLSPRERQVVDLVAAGRTSTEVAESLVMLAATADTHLRNAMRSFGVHARPHALAGAARADGVGQS